MKARKPNLLKGNSRKAKLLRRIKTDLQEGFRLIKLHQEGKIKLKSADELISEL